MLWGPACGRQKLIYVLGGFIVHHHCLLVAHAVTVDLTHNNAINLGLCPNQRLTLLCCSVPNHTPCLHFKWLARTTGTFSSFLSMFDQNIQRNFYQKLYNHLMKIQVTIKCWSEFPIPTAIYLITVRDTWPLSAQWNFGSGPKSNCHLWKFLKLGVLRVQPQMYSKSAMSWFFFDITWNWIGPLKS